MSFVSSFEEEVDVVDEIEALRVGKASSCMLSKETIDYLVVRDVVWWCFGGGSIDGGIGGL